MGMTHEEISCRSVSERANFHTMLTRMGWYSAGNGQVAKSWELPPRFLNPKGWTKSLAVKCEKTPIGWIFKQLLGLIILGLTKREMQIWPPMVSIQIHAQCMSPQYPRSFPKRPRHTGSLTEKTWWIGPLDVGFAFCVSVGAFLMVTHWGGIAAEKWPPRKCFEAVCDCQHAEFWEKKASGNSVLSCLYLLRTV